MADNYKDFDANVEEDTQEELEFVLGGKQYSLPGQIPARVILTQMRYMDETGVVPTSVIPEWLESLLGKKDFRRGCREWSYMATIRIITKLAIR